MPAGPVDLPTGGHLRPPPPLSLTPLSTLTALSNCPQRRNGPPTFFQLYYSSRRLSCIIGGGAENSSEQSSCLLRAAFTVSFYLAHNAAMYSICRWRRSQNLYLFPPSVSVLSVIIIIIIIQRNPAHH